jgi:antirestriction protein
MKKSEKRRIGEARQAELLKQSQESGLKAQQQAHEIAAKRKATLDKIAARKKAKEDAEKAAKAMKTVGENASVAAKTISQFVNELTRNDVEGDYPEVLDMTDETAYSG